MSFDREIGHLFTLASLPRSNGRVQASSVCSLSGIKKKKRTEVVVAVDGEGIFIYSIQNPQLAASYALPPETSFHSAPHSIYYKRTRPNRPRRYTYASVSQPTSVSKSQLVCFAEEVDNDGALETVKTSFTIPEAARSILLLDTLPCSPGGPQPDRNHDILLVLDTGHVECLSAALDKVQWTADINSLHKSLGQRAQLEYATLCTARSVVHGLLKDRPDLTATLQPSPTDDSDILDLTQVLCILYRRPDGQRLLGLFKVEPHSPDLPMGHKAPLKFIWAWDLPSSHSKSFRDPTNYNYHLHASSGNLYILGENALACYEFAGTAPKIYSKMDISTSRTNSFLRISQDILFTASEKSCQILDVKYCSTQAQLILPRTPSAASPQSKKRKLPDSPAGEGMAATPVLITHYTEPSLVVGIHGNELVGLELRGAATRKRPKKEATRLIDSLGKGIASKSTNASQRKGNTNKHRQALLKKRTELDQYAGEDQVAQFEEVFAALFDAGLADNATPPTSQSRYLDGISDTNLPNGADDEVIMEDGAALQDKALTTGTLPERYSGSLQPHHRDYVLYALSKIFHWVASPSTHDQSRGLLKVAFFPPNVFQWLLQAGQLTKESIRRAILDHCQEFPDAGVQLKDGDIVRAIVTFDPELHILSALLNHSQFLPIGEVVQAIKLLIHSLDDQPNANGVAGLLTNGEDDPEAMDIDIDSELEAASEEIDHALAILDSGLDIRSNTLRPALVRLHAFPSPVISSTLRSMLTRPDLESLMRLLHHDFKNGGWTSQYDFHESEGLSTDPQTEETDDSAVAILAALLSCTLDAIGPTTFISNITGSGTPNATEKFIEDLFQDTSVALNGFWEANFIRHLVNELLRFASKLPESHKPSNARLREQGKPFALDLKQDELPMLPLGGKADLGIERTKVGTGGREQPRSAREMGMLISKRVPKYSFERIVI